MKTCFISTQGHAVVICDTARTAFEDGRKWNDELRNDFKALREVGHDHPDMAKIEAMLEPTLTETP
jgi:hypothetical protein